MFTETIQNTVFQLDISLAAAPPKTFQHDTLTTLRNVLANEITPALEKIDRTRYSPQGYQDKQRSTVEKTLTPVLDRVSKQLDANTAKVQEQLTTLVITSPLDQGDKAERLSHEREIRDVYRGMDSLTLENTLWEGIEGGDITPAVAVLRSPLTMLAPDAKQRLVSHLRNQQHPGASALEGQLSAIDAVRGYITGLRRDVLQITPDMIFA